jgi:hypothetical protein
MWDVDKKEENEVWHDRWLGRDGYLGVDLLYEEPRPKTQEGEMLGQEECGWHH